MSIPHFVVFCDRCGAQAASHQFFGMGTGSPTGRRSLPTGRWAGAARAAGSTPSRACRTRPPWNGNTRPWPAAAHGRQACWARRASFCRPSRFKSRRLQTLLACLTSQALKLVPAACSTCSRLRFRFGRDLSSVTLSTTVPRPPRSTPAVSPASSGCPRWRRAAGRRAARRGRKRRRRPATWLGDRVGGRAEPHRMLRRVERRAWSNPSISYRMICCCSRCLCCARSSLTSSHAAQKLPRTPSKATMPPAGGKKKPTISPSTTAATMNFRTFKANFRTIIPQPPPS